MPTALGDNTECPDPPPMVGLDDGEPERRVFRR